MNVEDSDVLIGSHQLISSIEAFSESVAQFLLPVIIFVGHKDAVFESLQRSYAGLIHEKKYSGARAHLVIFEEVPYHLMTDDCQLPPDTAYIFCLDEDQALESVQLQFLKTRMSVRLIKPDAEQLIWHMKSLLLLQDVAYANGSEFFPSMLSVDADFRAAITKLILSVVELQSCVVRVDSLEMQRDLQSFLFDMLPSVIRPYTFNVRVPDLNLSSLPTDRICLTTPRCDSNREMNDLMNSTMLNDAIVQKPVIAIVANTSAWEPDDSDLISPINIPTLESKTIDVQLLAYWCSAYRSNVGVSPMQYSHGQVEEALRISKFDRHEFLSSLLSLGPELETAEDSFTNLISQYERLSIDDVFGEAEQRVMQKLRGRSLLVDSASAAAGIPKVTFHKRMKRLGEKQTLIGLLSNEHRIE
ncbi:hypothetical protein [Maritalea sp.]|uniref:hypothetical protein n=1 Tax=Maritalea sp. TaxID=2003361 RepID=UPI003EF24F61